MSINTSREDCYPHPSDAAVGSHKIPSLSASSSNTSGIVSSSTSELIAAAGHAIVEDNEFFKEKKKGHLFLRVLYYLVPMSILTGIYIWIAYY